MGLGAPRLVTFRPRERIRSVRRASAALQIERHEREPGRDPLAELGLGAVLGAHLYRVDVSAGLPSRDVRSAGAAFALKSLGARWL